jgi:hypothetical protein
MTPADKLATYTATDANGCIIWQRATNSRGYGLVCFNGKSHLAHRVAWELEHGPIADDMTVDHLCRVKRCVNPAHMEIVTREENTRRGSPNVGKTHCKRGHELAGDNLVIKPRAKGQGFIRNCRTCNTEGARLRRFRDAYLAPVVELPAAAVEQEAKAS